MSTNKKFRIQNGADIHGGGLSIDDVIVIGADGKVVAGAIQEAVAELTAADIADLQAQVTAILGTSPETLDTLQEIVTAFENADSTLTGSVAQNATDIATINDTLQSGVATPSDIAALEATIGSGESFSGYLFVGAPQDDTDPVNDHGSVYAWTAESNYTQSIKLTAPVPTQYDRFGSSIQFGGGRLAVLATGNDTVYLYDDISGTPVELSVPTSVSNVAIGDTHVAVGGYGPFAYVWELDNISAGYTQIQSPNHTDDGFYFGGETDGPGIAISGNILAIGQRDIKTLWIYDLDNLSSAPSSITRGENSFPSGVYASGETIYAKTTENNGSIHAYNVAGSLQSTFTGSGSSIFAQKDIAVSGDYFAARESGTVQTGNYTRGKVLVYNQSNLIATLDAPLSDGGNAGWAFGYGIEILGDNLFVGDYSYGDPTMQEGRVYKYDLNNLNASPVVMQSPDVAYDDQNGIVLTGGLISTTGSMDTSASTVFGAVNELHTEIEALSSLQSGDTSSLTSAIATAKSEAISTAAADATTKADQAEADAKAYADQVVAATVDAAPAALDTLNELAAALGDDENFASTVTASIATKADDAATTAALDLKEDKTTVSALDTFVKGPGSYSLSNEVSTNIDFWGLGNGASKIGYSNGALSWSMDNTSATGGFNYQQNSLTYYSMSNLVVGTDYVLTITSPSRAGNLTVVVGDSSNTVDAQVVMPAGSTTVTSQIEFTAVATSRIIALDAASTGVYSISSVQVTDAETLQTTATQIVPAINELVDSVASLTSGTSSDLAAETAARIAGDASTLSSASSDATSKADAAEASAKAYADQVVAATVDAAPAALDTLNELAAALGDDANFASTVTASIATKASQVDHDAEVARATAAEQANATAIAAANARTSGISTSSGSSNIEMGADVDMGTNDIDNAGDINAARGFIDTIEAESLTVQTGTVDFSGSTVNFGSSQIIGGGFDQATQQEIDQHLNVSAANPQEFLKWNGTDYEFTDYIQGRLATDQLEVGDGGSISASIPGSTLDWQDGLVHFGGSEVIIDETPTSSNHAANKAYVDAETTLVAGDGISVDNLTHTVSLDGSAISQNLVPDSDNVYTLGSPDKVWKDVYIGPGSLYIGGQKVIEDNSGTITINADPNQNLTVQTTGTGGLNVQSTGSGGISIDAASESVQVKSDMVVSVGKTISTVGGAATKFGGDIDMQTNTVSGLGAPSMDADAATKLYVDDRIAESTISGGKTFSDDVIISGNLTVSGTTTTVNSETISLADNIIDLNSNLTSGAPSENAGIRVMRGDESAVQVRWNETSDHWETYNGSAWTKIALSTSDLAEGSNQYFTEERAKACFTGGLCITYSSVTGEIKVDEAEAESSLRVAESAASDDADKLDGQEGTYYRINVYNVAGTLVN